jgi:hypothetical protein
MHSLEAIQWRAVKGFTKQDQEQFNPVCTIGITRTHDKLNYEQTNRGNY